MGIGTVVNTADGRSKRQHNRAACQGCNDSYKDNEAESSPPSAEDNTRRHQEKRPEQVELLFNGKRPKVREKFGRSLSKIVVTAENREPVR